MKFLAVVLFISACRFPSDSMQLSGSLKRRIERALAEATTPDETTSATSSTDRRGSLRRRIERATAQQGADIDEDLPLNDKLKRAWASGKMSSVMVNEFAQAAQEQGARGLERVSSSGTSGVWPQNIQRNLLTFFGKPAGAPSCTWVLLPTTKGTIAHPVYLPHEFFAILYLDRRDLWEQWVRGALRSSHHLLEKSARHSNR